MNTPATERLFGAVGSRPLPRGWRSVRLSDVCEESIPTRDPRDSPTDSFRYVDITSVSNVSKRIVSPKTVLGNDAPSRARQVNRTGDVLVATTRPNLNAVAVVPTELDGEIASTGFCVLRAKSGLDPRYLFGFVQMGETVRNLSELVKGALYPAVTDAQVRAQWLPLPELSEQRRIVDVLAEQMAAVEQARAAAEAQLDAAKAFKRACFRAAFESDATRDWDRVRLGDLALSIQNGVYKAAHYYGHGKPLLRMYNLQKDSWLLDLDRLALAELSAAEAATMPGDLLVSRVNSFVIVQQMSTDHIRRQIGEVAKRAIGQASINSDDIRQLQLLLPSLSAQRQIASDLARRTSAADGFKERLEMECEVIAKLPAALLRCAFSGEL